MHRIQKIHQTLIKLNKFQIGTELEEWYTNTTSLNNKIHELRLLINIHRPDVVCVAETWFKPQSDVQVNGYNIY